MADSAIGGGAFEGIVGGMDVAVIVDMAPPLLTTALPRRQGVVGSRMASRTVVAVCSVQVGRMTKGAVDDNVEVRTRLAVGPGRIIMGTIGENGHHRAAGRRAMIDVTMYRIEIVAGSTRAAAGRKRFVRFDERTGPQGIEMTDTALVAMDASDQIRVGRDVTPKTRIDRQDKSGGGMVESGEAV